MIKIPNRKEGRMYKSTYRARWFVFSFLLSSLFISGISLAQECPGPRNISCGDWKYENTSYSDDDNHSSYSCTNNSSGPENYWTLTIGDCSNVDIELDPDDGDGFGWDAVLVLLGADGSDCDLQQCIAGADDGADGSYEEINADLAPGTYYIVVDGWMSGDYGWYDLHVSCSSYSCTDSDNDGFTGSGCPCGEDCNDSDPQVHPGAADDTCDFVDNDCDGVTDEDANTGDDINNCGFCGNVCSYDNAQAQCSSGTCVMGSCNAGTDDCNSSDSDGCETVLGTEQDCAACGDTCSFDHASGTCVQSACVMGSCEQPWGDCNSSPSDGCETALGTDSNCSACGDACENGFFCYEQTCTDHCPEGMARCSGLCIDITSDSSNCGGCDVICSPPNARGACENSSCSIQSCDPGFADCDTQEPNGCETTLGTTLNCSACGEECQQGQECINNVCTVPCHDNDSDGHDDASCGGDDCDDSNSAVRPGAAEICGDGIDQDCDGSDEQCPCPDADGDTFTDIACGGDDCNDGNFSIHPGAVDACGDGIDQDCDGHDTPCACADADNDGYQDASCGGNDCIDTDPNIHPGATDTCGDGIDQDCSGADTPCDCPDADSDGHQDQSCGGDDCDDSDNTIYPGATDTCDDGVDQDCDGHDTPCDCPDADNDGYKDAACGGDDCEDGSSFIHPGAEEICSDGVDQDCDGKDLPCSSCMDNDGDGYLSVDCGGDDCDDENPNINPAAIESCDDGIDQNCDGKDKSCGGLSGCGCSSDPDSSAHSGWAFLMLLLIVGFIKRK